MKIIFVTNCDSWLWKKFGRNKLVNSFKYFHPDLDIVTYNENDTNRIMLENVGFDRISYMPIIMKEVKKIYNADIVCHLDSDSIVLGKLDEILENDYEIVGCRNDGDHATGDESQNRPHPIKNLPRELYMSCGCIATSSDEFLDDWYNLNKEIIKKYGSLHPYIPMGEQGSYNILFHSGKYKTKILDPKGGNLFYGASANIDKLGKTSPEHIIKEWGFDNWQSWKEIYYENNKFLLYGKECKLIHMAGGGKAKTAVKLSFDMFNPNIIDKLKEITQCNE